MGQTTPARRGPRGKFDWSGKGLTLVVAGIVKVDPAHLIVAPVVEMQSVHRILRKNGGSSRSSS